MAACAAWGQLLIKSSASILKDRALARRFQKIDVVEPSVGDSIKILQGLKTSFEEFHQVRYTNDALKTAVELSARYMAERKLPDKAIDVIDEVGASQKLLPVSKRKKTISVKDIENVIATMARIPPKTVSKDDTEKLRSLDVSLKRVVFGQDAAIDALSSSIKLSRAGLREANKPIGSYLFSGPTGVGKPGGAPAALSWALNCCALICRNMGAPCPAPAWRTARLCRL